MRLVACLVAVLFAPVSLVAVDDPAASFAALKAEWGRQEGEYAKAIDATKTAAERDAVNARAPREADFAARFLKLAEAHPGTRAELNALCWAALNAPDCEPGRKALAALAGGRVEKATPTAVAAALEASRTRSSQDKRPLAVAMLACAKRSPDDPKAAWLLAHACVGFMDDRGDAPPAVFAEAAELIVSRHADSDDVSHFVEALFLHGVPPWGGKYEKHLRTLVDNSQTPHMRVTTRYALAAVVRSAGVERQAEAESLFRAFAADYDGKRHGGVETTLASMARQQIARIERVPLGKPAPPLAADDLDGKPAKLSDHRGEVVLVVFWASWCGPCLADVPHEKELVARFKGRPFTILGVNGDIEPDEAAKAVAKAGIPWRSLRSGSGKAGSLTKAWAVNAWPTLFVIDHEGVVRHDDLRGKWLDAPLEALVKQAEAAKGK